MVVVVTVLLVLVQVAAGPPAGPLRRARPWADRVARGTSLARTEDDTLCSYQDLFQALIAALTTTTIQMCVHGPATRREPGSPPAPVSVTCVRE